MPDYYQTGSSRKRFFYILFERQVGNDASQPGDQEYCAEDKFEEHPDLLMFAISIMQNIPSILHALTETR